MKKVLSILLVLMLALTLCAGAVAEEKMYIPVMAKGFQHQFWQTVYAGAQAAAAEYGVEIYFDGPASETNIDEQVEMLKSEMAKNPVAIALAALSTDSVMTELQECVDKGIPVIGFDSGVPNAPEGAIYATASTDNEAAAALAAVKLMEQEGFADMLAAGTADAPVVIAVISQEAVSGSIVGRTTGFVNKIVELASANGTVSVTGHDIWKNEVADASII
ncbi:MAG: substrate-binding domain-containing protein, partial [Clostridia bacterium]|nr:substrate-binding domain-containing protein [Clostridia bacterium]